VPSFASMNAGSGFIRSSGDARKLDALGAGGLASENPLQSATDKMPGAGFKLGGLFSPLDDGLMARALAAEVDGCILQVKFVRT
jgi:hypothetical protein